MSATAAGCSAIDNFGRFTVDGGTAAASCTPGCTCVAGTPSLGVPDHCAVAPLGALSCAGFTRNADVLMLAAGNYTLDSGATPPILLDANGIRVANGNVSGATALFCIGSLVANGGTRIGITGNRPVAILADSLISMASGGIALAGEYAIDVNGGRGVAGGSDGGGSGSNAAGTGGGHAGGGSPGAGGSGGGSAQAGGLGGPGGGSTMFTTSGSGSSAPTVGFGGGGGGKGASQGGGGGGGAGALQLSASYAINFDQVELNASGGGGAGGAAASIAGGASGGGGGGGGGGIVVLDAPTVTITGGCISVIGGPGGAGAGSVRGGDAKANAMCGFSGAGGIAPPSGGSGGAASAQQPNGGAGSATGGGGGGIGGFGRVTVRAQNPPPQTQPPGVVPATAYFPMTLP